MDHSAQHQFLRMGRHRVASQQDHNSRNQVPLRPTVSLPTQPDTQETGAPPDNSHTRMLEIIMRPILAPAVLGECVDTTPDRNNDGVEEFLAPTSSSKPELAHEQEDSKKDTVGNERTSHNEMRQTLPQVIIMTKSQGRNSTKYHLCPTRDGHNLADNSMETYSPGTQFDVDAS